MKIELESHEAILRGGERRVVYTKEEVERLLYKIEVACSGGGADDVRESLRGWRAKREEEAPF